MGGTHLADAHHIVGLVVVVLAFLQPLNAYFRPDKPSTDDDDDNDQHDEITAAAAKNQTWCKRRMTARSIWEFCHKMSGRLTVVLAWTNAFLGIVLLQSWYGASDTTCSVLVIAQSSAIGLRSL